MVGELGSGDGYQQQEQVYVAILQKDDKRLTPRCLLVVGRLQQKSMNLVENDIVEIFQEENEKTCKILVRLHKVENNKKRSEHELWLPEAFIDESLNQKCVQVTEKLEYCGVSASVTEIWFNNGAKSESAYIDSETRIVLRSSSVKMCIIIQMTADMYDYHSAGETSLEGLINFFRELLHRWGKAGARHLVTIILTTRLWFPTVQKIEDIPEEYRGTFEQSLDGRWFRDFYQVVCQELMFSGSLQFALLMTLKNDTEKFWSLIQLNWREGQFTTNYSYTTLWLRYVAAYSVTFVKLSHSGQSMLCEITQPHDSNMLEALFLALDSYDEHNIDRRFDR
eukprot:gene5079-6978_t